MYGVLLLNDLYSSSNIVRVIKSRRMRWAGHVAGMSEERGAYRVLVGKPERLDGGDCSTSYPGHLISDRRGRCSLNTRL